MISSFGLLVFYDYRKRLKRFKELLEHVKQPSESYSTQHKTIVIDDVVKQLLFKLDSFEKSRAFIERTCSLKTLSIDLETNTSYLSKVINDYKGMNFSSYISGLRVNEVIKELKEDEVLRQKTIEAIAIEFGFSSTRSFSRAFNKVTGLSPSFFIKNLNNFN